MKRTRIRRTWATATALVTMGLAVAAVSCTGPAKTKPAPQDKTTGPALAKGDKTVAKPGSGPTAATPKKPSAPAKPSGATAKAPKKPAVAKKPAGMKKPGTAVARGDQPPPPPPRPGAPLPPPVKPRPRTGDVGAAKQPVKPAQPKKPVVAKKPVKPAQPMKPVKPAQPKKPVVAKQPAVAKQPSKASSEADRILEARAQELRLEREKNAILVQDYLDHARDSARRFEWADTEEWAAKALGLDHDNKEAESLLRQARAAQGYADADSASVTELLFDAKSVRQEQSRFSAQRYWNSAMKAKADGDYAGAMRYLDNALTVVQNDPSGVDWGSMERDIRAAMAEVGNLKGDSDRLARRKAAAEAYRAVKGEEARSRLAEIERRNAMLSAAMDAFDKEQWARAEALLRDYLELAPDDANARSLLNTANRAKHNRASDDSLKLQRDRLREWRIDMKETTTPYHRILTWPSREHWNRITELRKDAGVIAEPETDSPETAATRNRLRSERISFAFTGEDFKNVINYIRTAKSLNIVIEPEVEPELESVPVTLSLSDIPIAQALDTLNSVAGDLIYVVQGSVILITKPELARADPIVQVHAVGDLTVALTNFIAPNLELLPAGAEEDEDNPTFGGTSEGVPSFGGAEDLVTLIQANVANEDYWGSEGVSVSVAGNDKLVIVAEPEVQKQTAQFLNDLRGFAGIVVTIETRFLTVTDNFLRDVGVDIRGLGGASPGPLSVLDDVTNGLINNASAGFDNGGVGLPANASGRPSSGAFFNNNSDGDYRARSENIFDRALGDQITNVGGAVIQYTLVDDTSVALILRAVEKRQQGRVLQAPSVTVYNTQRANITLITQLSFIQDFDVEVAQTAFIADPIIGVIQDGLVLDVQPTVSHDRKYITVQLKPTVANLVRPIPTFTTSLGAFTTPVTIQIPELNVAQAATTVRIPDGGTLLLGGLKDIQLTDLKSETPWFSNLPFASFFMGRRGSVQEQSNLLIIVKAEISDLQEQDPHLPR